MKNIQLLFLLLCGLVFTTNTSVGQANFSLYNMHSIMQGQYENPAFRSKAKVGLSIMPFSSVVNFRAINSSFAIDDVLQTRPADDSLDLTIDKAVQQMRDKNYFDVDMRNEFLALCITTRQSSFSLTANHVMHSSFTYPKGLLTLLYYGNGTENSLGQRIPLDGLGYNLMSYLDLGIGWNRKFGDKLVIGARLKYLRGIANVQTKESAFGLYTDPKTFALTVDGKAMVNTSNTTAFYIDGISISSEEVSTAFFRSKNHGIGLDIGATFQLNDAWSFSASVLDLGWIKWKDHVKNYEVEPFEFTYEGVDINRFINDTTDIIEELVDTLTELTDINETEESYTTSLYSRFYVGGNWHVTDNFNLGLSWYNAVYADIYRTGVNLSANFNLKYWLSTSLNYSIYNYGKSNIGVGVSVRLGTFQIYGMTNSILSLINPQSQRLVDAHVGLSFQIGKVREKSTNAD